MNQKLAWSLFLGGLGSFLLAVAQFFAGHHSWVELTTPDALSHLIPAIAAFVSTMAGALGIGNPPA